MKFIIATNNAKKLKELERILKPLGIDAVSAKEAGVNLGEVEETGTTFAENAFIKANAAFKATGMPAIADDSGLSVDALDGRPGVYSARYCGENATDEEKYTKLLEEMRGVPDEKRTAHFTSAICCILSDKEKLKLTAYATVQFLILRTATAVLDMTRFLTATEKVLPNLQPKKKTKSATEELLYASYRLN